MLETCLSIRKNSVRVFRLARRAVKDQKRVKTEHDLDLAGGQNVDLYVYIAFLSYKFNGGDDDDDVCNKYLPA